MVQSTQNHPAQKAPPETLENLRQGLARDRKKLEKLLQSDPEVAEVIERLVTMTEATISQLEAAEKLQTADRQEVNSESPKPASNGKSKKPKKPAKPYKDFPLFAHATGRWCKKIRGKHHYFGKWDDPDAALAKYVHERDDLHAGRTPRDAIGDGLTVAELCDRFLNVKKNLINGGELAEITFQNYHRGCSQLNSRLGERLVDDLRAEDFTELRTALSKTLGPSSLKSAISNIRAVFNFAYEERLITEPIHYGGNFNKPSRKVIKMARQKKWQHGKRMLSAEELRKMLSALDGNIEIAKVNTNRKKTGEFKTPQPDPVMKAMVLLGANCGFGQTDISSLPQSAIDFKTGWIDYPRLKTGEERRILLWKETLDAIHDAIFARPRPRNPEDEDLVFLTNQGRRWVRFSNGEKRTWRDDLGRSFSDLLFRLNMKRDGLNFYALRHGFETVSSACLDQVAVNSCMGHVDSTMSGVYRESISDERLKNVTDVVHDWLWPQPEEECLSSE
jgi:integrase